MNLHLFIGSSGDLHNYFYLLSAINNYDCLWLLLFVFRDDEGKLRVFSVKVALATLCSSKPLDKLRCKYMRCFRSCNIHGGWCLTVLCSCEEVVLIEVYLHYTYTTLDTDFHSATTTSNSSCRFK